MVTFWRSWAERLTEKEKARIVGLSYGWAWLNYDKATRGYQGTFYYFPQNSGYHDSPPIPAEIAQQHKTRFIGLERGWLHEEAKSFFTPLETIADMFPAEMEKLFERYKTEIIGGTSEKII